MQNPRRYRSEGGRIHRFRWLASNGIGGRFHRNTHPNDKNSSAARFSALDDVKAEKLKAFTKTNLELALAGNIESGYIAAKTMDRCKNAAHSLDEVKLRTLQSILRAQIILDAGGSLPPIDVDHPGNTFESDEANKNHHTRWYLACLEQAELFNDKFRKRLDQLASQGNVVARYLYAVWPPDFLGDEDAFLLQQEWEYKAREYSFLNLEEGEIAGLLAFGQSYTSQNLFTRYDIYYGYAMFKAANDCGFRAPDIQSIVDTYFNFERNPESLSNRQPEVLIAARGLTKFCE